MTVTFLAVVSLGPPDDVRIPAENRLTEVGKGLSAALHILTGGRIGPVETDGSLRFHETTADGELGTQSLAPAAP